MEEKKQEEEQQQEKQQSPPPLHSSSFTTTPEHFTIFKEEAQYWIDKFGLKGYKVFFLHADRDLDEDGKSRGFANYNASMVGRNAVLCLTKTWNDQGLQDGITEEQIRSSAFHEVWELLLHRLFHMAENRAYTEYDFEEEKHNVIRIMENVVWREDWEGRKDLAAEINPPLQGIQNNTQEFLYQDELQKARAYEKYLEEMLSDPRYQWLEEEGRGDSANTSDRGFLAWIHQRMVKIHKEDPLTNDMYRLRDIIAAMPKGVKSPQAPADMNVDADSKIEEWIKAGQEPTAQPFTPSSKLNLAVAAFNTKNNPTFEGRAPFRDWLKDAIARIGTCMDELNYSDRGRWLELGDGTIPIKDLFRIAKNQDGSFYIDRFKIRTNEGLTNGIHGIEILVGYPDEIVGHVMVRPNGELSWYDEPGLRMRSSAEDKAASRSLQGKPDDDDL